MKNMSIITQAISYIPYGEVFVEQQSGGWSSPYLFNAKELDSETGLYYYGARYLDPSDAMWLSVDPLWEKYVGMTPYQYCHGNPIIRVDPDGRGDFIDENGVIIGNDGKDDGKLYAFRNKQLTQEQLNFAKKFVSSGVSSAFNDDFYSNYVVEIESNVDNRQTMVDVISQDNGQGGTNDNNCREYGGWYDSRKEKIREATPGVVMECGKSSVLIKLNPLEGEYSFHSHPSGTKYDEFGNVCATTKNPGPSDADIEASGNVMEYVFDRKNGNVYIYNKNGIQATMPTNYFVKPKSNMTNRCFVVPSSSPGSIETIQINGINSKK